jgi:hypothetical protein
MPQNVGEIWQYERHHQKMIVIITSFKPNIYSRQYAFCDCYIISSQHIAEFQTGEFKQIYLSDQDGWKRVA